MAIINRLSRLITADFHAVLDRIEEPGVLLRQAIREMEQALAAREQRLKELERDQQQLSDRAGELNNLIQRVEQELDVCFEAGKDELAKSQIKRKLEAERLLMVIERRHQQVEQLANTEGQELNHNRTRLDSMKQKAELFAERESAHHDARPEDRQSDCVVSDDEVEVAFLRAQQARASS